MKHLKLFEKFIDNLDDYDINIHSGGKLLDLDINDLVKKIKKHYNYESDKVKILGDSDKSIVVYFEYDNVVVKITTDIEEYLGAKQTLGKEFEYIYTYKKVDNFNYNGNVLYILTMDKLKMLTTLESYIVDKLPIYLLSKKYYNKLYQYVKNTDLDVFELKKITKNRLHPNKFYYHFDDFLQYEIDPEDQDVCIDMYDLIKNIVNEIKDNFDVEYLNIHSKNLAWKGDKLIHFDIKMPKEKK